MLLENNILVLLIVLIPFIMAAIIPLLGRISISAMTWMSVIAAFLLAFLVFLFVPDIFFDHVMPIGPANFLTGESAIAYNWIPSAGITFGVYIDALSLTMALIASGIGALVVLYSVKYMEGQKGLPRYYSLVLLFIGAMVCLAFTDNLLILYIFWEIIGLCSYALIGFYNEDPKAARAGIKAFVVTRIGDIGLLIGIFVLYAGAGTFRIPELLADPPSMTYLAPAAFLFILGAMGKSAQVPLHVWLPDAMEAPTTVSALIHAATLVNSGIYILARMSPIFFEVAGWGEMLMIVGGITALLAAIMALVEPDLKKLLAYSTISQLGYMVFALGIIEGVGTAHAIQIGLLAATFHLLSHAVFKALLFLGAGSVIHSVGTRNMYEMGGLKDSMKVTHITMLFGTLALAGIVPFAGFWSKDLIFGAAWDAGFYLPMAVMVITAIFTVAYSFRMYWLVFREPPKPWAKPAHESPAAMTIPLILLAIGAIGVWILISYFSQGMFYQGYVGLEQAYDLPTFINHTFSDIVPVSMSFLAMGLGIVFFLGRKGAVKSRAVRAVLKPASRGFGFDTFYGGIIVGLKEVGLRLRRTQSGDANLNAVGIVVAFVIVVLFIMAGGVF